MEVECSSACALSLAAGNVCESFNSLSLRQLNPLPNEHGVFLDLVFSDLLDVRFSEAVDLLFDNNFHHNAVYFEFPAIKSIQVLTEDTLVYDFDKCNVSELRTYLRRVDWQSIFSDDINSSVESFYKILLAGIELSTPHRIIRSSSFPRWFSGDLRRLTFEKKKAHLVYKRTNLQSDYDRFSSLRAQCCLLRDSCYSAYMGKINNQLKSNPRSFWRFSEETRKVSGFPKEMFLRDSTVSTGQETADLFAESFSSAYKESGLPIPDYPFWDVIDFGDIALSEAEVLRTLSSLPSKFSSGPDKVPPYILKVCSSVLSLPLSIIFNKSLSSGVFPSAWKVSFILPIFKSGNRCDIANYRGVCIQSTIPKVLDKILCNKLSFACKRFISNYQHGFAHQRSTVTNLLSYQHDILQSFDSGHCVHSVYTDVAKAFDRVDSRLLIAKLKSYGIGESFLRWLSDYLCGRTQQVRLGNSLSSSIDVLSGVGQGSHIGPLLFSLFFNDLPDVICHSSILMFADDVKLYKSITCPEDCLLLQSDLERFYSWLSMNGMELSLHKCFVIEFSRSRGSTPFAYHLNSVPLQHVPQIKDLGVIFDRNLSFIPQISNLSMRCFRILGYIYRNSKGLSSESFSLLYKSLLRSLLEYACVVWSPYYEVHSNTLERVQKRFLRYFQYRFPFRNSNLDPLVDRRKTADMKFIEKLLEGQVDCAKLLELLTLDCTRRVRRCKTFKIDTVHTNYAFNAPINRMMRLANEM
ncbi:hypothetical protein WDU94_005624 [Cyamophila willieti]